MFLFFSASFSILGSNDFKPPNAPDRAVLSIPIATLPPSILSASGTPSAFASFTAFTAPLIAFAPATTPTPAAAPPAAALAASFGFARIKATLPLILSNNVSLFSSSSEAKNSFDIVTASLMCFFIAFTSVALTPDLSVSFALTPNKFPIAVIIPLINLPILVNKVVSIPSFLAVFASFFSTSSASINESVSNTPSVTTPSFIKLAPSNFSSCSIHADI